MLSRIRVLPSMLAATASLFVLTSVLLAQTPAKPAVPASTPTAPTLSPEELKAKQEAIAKQFTTFKESLFRLAKRLEKSERAEDKETAKVVLKAIEEAMKQNVEGQFNKLILGLSKNGKSIGDLGAISADEQQLAKVLQEILNILNTDDESARIKAEIARLEAILKEAKVIKTGVESVQSRTEGKIGDKDRLKKEQDDLAKRTDDLAKKAGGDDKKLGDKPADAKAENKADPKAGESSGDDKKDTGADKGEAKEGEPKDAGDPKDAGKDAPKDAGMPKAGADMGKEGDAGMPKDAKSGMGEAKGKGEGKGMGEGKGEGKPGEGKGQGGEGKGAGKGMPGMGGEGQPGEPKPGGGQPGQPGPGGPPKPGQKPAPGAKEIAQAVPPQEGAAKDLDMDKRPDAGKKQDKAIEELAKAIEELEKRLKQLREEEMKKLLANIEARCGKMLAMQIDVYEATKSIDKGIIAKNGVKETGDIQKSQTQGDKEGQIVTEADAALKLLESEGSAVAFAKVLEEVRQDMIAVQRRLNQTYVDKNTQQIEEEIIAMLKDMIEALKKAQAELGKPQEPKPPSDSKPADKKLIDLLAELKLIRTLQLQVNNRTTMYGNKDKAEQAKDPIVQGELRQLSARQAKLQEMIDKIAAGSNQ